MDEDQCGRNSLIDQLPIVDEQTITIEENDNDKKSDSSDFDIIQSIDHADEISDGI